MCVANTEDTVVQVITDAKQYRVGPFNWRHSGLRIGRDLNILHRIEGTSSALASYSSNKGIAWDLQHTDKLSIA